MNGSGTSQIGPLFVPNSATIASTRPTVLAGFDPYWPDLQSRVAGFELRPALLRCKK
jgi:hypothetical protein